MIVRTYPSVLSTTWSADLEVLGLFKQVMFHTKYQGTRNEYTNHIGLYDLTMQELVKRTNCDSKKKDLSPDSGNAKKWATKWKQNA